jgi:hypothetical protein
MKRTTGGGHLGLFMGREALRDAWPPMLADAARHSKLGAGGANKPAAERAARKRTPKAHKPVPAP